MDLGLKDKVALVTGGSSGIGLAIAAKLAAEGCKVAISGRDKAKLDAAVAEVPHARGFACDVRDGPQVSCLIADVIDAFGHIDIVVSNAGTHVPGRMEDVATGALTRHLETKVVGAWQLAKAVAPHMRQHGGGLGNHQRRATCLCEITVGRSGARQNSRQRRLPEPDQISPDGCAGAPL
jgi:3-oxoacyl-[acyl-carrier protein] reductase